MKIPIVVVFSIVFSSLAYSQSKGHLIDERDGQRYKWIQFGELIWMSENLIYESRGSGKLEERYGCVYSWADAQKVCPAGWHLPSDDEWKQLEEFLGMDYSEINKTLDFERESGRVGHRLKSKSGWQQYMGGSNGIDEFEFSILPGGYYHSSNRRYMLYGTQIIFWTSTSIDNEYGRVREFNSSSIGVGRTEMPKRNGGYIRCVKSAF